METRRGEVKSWDKGAGARLPGAFSGLAAASGFLGNPQRTSRPTLRAVWLGRGTKGAEHPKLPRDQLLCCSQALLPRPQPGCWWKALDATGALITIQRLCFRRPG